MPLQGPRFPPGLLFPKKSLDMGPILVKKSLGEGPISQKLQKKTCKSAMLKVEKPLEMGPGLWKLKKKKKQLSNRPFFEEEKSLDMGRGFRPWATQPRQK